MKVNSKMIFIMDMAALFIQMETIILEIGWMERDQAMGNQQTNQGGFMKDSGKIASSQGINEIKSVKSI